MDVVVDSWNKYNRSPHSHFIDDDICRFKRGHSIQKTYRILKHDYRDFEMYLLEKAQSVVKTRATIVYLPGKRILEALTIPVSTMNGATVIVWTLCFGFSCL